MTESSHLLDDPARSALEGRDERFAAGAPGAAVRYRPGVAPFASIRADADALLPFVSAADPVALFGTAVPGGWQRIHSVHLVQMTGEGAAAAPRSEPLVALGEEDVDAMAELVDVARPGPFGRSTVLLGGYVGIRREGRLVAMAGERMHPDGWAEVSAVATHPDARGQGLGTLALLTVADEIRARGLQPFLHVAVENRAARRLYESLGFAVRRELTLTVAAPTSAATVNG